MSEKKKVGRPKGSTNKITKKDVNVLEERIKSLEKELNSYDEVVDTFVDGCVLELKNSIKFVSNQTLQRWFSNPDKYMQEISDLLTYYYIIDGDISQLYDLIFSLPELTYSIKCYEKTDSYKEDILKIKKMLNKINHKLLTRSMLTQLAHDGTLLGTWLGTKKDPYFYVFDNLKYVFPYGNYHGKMIGVYDLSYLDVLTDAQRKALYENLYPFVTEIKYNKWKNETDIEKKKVLQYLVLPPDISLVARNRLLNANQRLGLPLGTQAIFSLRHKQKLKDLEASVADKIIRAIAVLKMDDKNSFGDKIKEGTRKKLFNKVKSTLERSIETQSGITCIGIPSWANFEPAQIQGGDKVLNPDKYETVDNDITVSTGVSSVLSNGTNGNYSSAELNLRIIYKKIGSMLEQIEEIYNQLIKIILGKKGNNYIFEYNKDMPLTKNQKLDAVSKLVDKGYSLKTMTDLLGIDFEDYISQSLYEIEELKLRDKIIPPMSTYTMSKSDNNDGSPTVDEATNENTIQSQGSNSNNNPKPSTS